MKATVMGVKWFYRVLGEEVGPVTSIELKDEANRGEILVDSQVRKDVDGEWLPVGKVKNLFDGKRVGRQPLNRLLPKRLAVQSALRRSAKGHG